MHLAYGTDFAGPDHFAELTRADVRMPLVAHLRGDLVLARHLGEHARFPNGARHRLLHVDVQSALDGPSGGHAVNMIGSGDHHRVDALLLVEHPAEILVARGLRVAVECLGGPDIIGIAQRDDVLGDRAGVDVAVAFAANTDAGDVQFLIGRFVSGAFKRSCTGRQHGGCQEEVSTRQTIVHEDFLSPCVPRSPHRDFASALDNQESLPQYQQGLAPRARERPITTRRLPLPSIATGPERPKRLRGITRRAQIRTRLVQPCNEHMSCVVCGSPSERIGLQEPGFLGVSPA